MGPKGDFLAMADGPKGGERRIREGKKAGKGCRRSKRRLDAGPTGGTALPLFLQVAVPRKNEGKLDVGLLRLLNEHAPRRQAAGGIGGGGGGTMLHSGQSRLYSNSRLVHAQ